MPIKPQITKDDIFAMFLFIYFIYIFLFVCLLRNSVNKKTFQSGYYNAEIGGFGYGGVTFKASKVSWKKC